MVSSALAEAVVFAFPLGFTGLRDSMTLGATERDEGEDGGSDEREGQSDFERGGTGVTVMEQGDGS